MKLIPELTDLEAHREFRRFFSNIPRRFWKQKLAKIRSLPRFAPPSANAYIAYLAHMNPLTEAIGMFLKIESRGEVVRNYLTPKLMKACGHLKIINAMFNEATPTTAKKIRSILLDDETVKSFLFEIDVATHFFARGLDVQFVDLKGSGNCDLLVSNGEEIIEIECKTKSADAGRKIVRPNFYLLCDVLAAKLSPLTESFALLFKCDGRLSGSQEFFYQVAEEIRACKIQQRSQGTFGSVRFEVKNLPAGTTIRTNDDAARLLAPYWTTNTHYFVLSGPQTLVIACESTDANRVLRSI
jgi:hypothetical protein